MLPVFRLINVCIVVLLLIRTARSSAEEPRQDIDPANIIEKFDAARDGVGHLSLPVTINNKKYLFILDTGSAGMLYDSSFRSLLGMPKKTEKVRTDAGKMELTTFDAPEAFLGKISLKTASEVVVSDLSSIREGVGVDYYGIIGMRFLKQHILRIDFDKGEVFFLKSLGSNPGCAFPLSFEHGVIHTGVLIPGCERKQNFCISTGADANVSGDISIDCINMLSRTHITKPLSGGGESTTLSGAKVKHVEYQLNAFSLGPFTHRDLIFSSSPTCDNTLGLGYLSRYIVTFDFPHQMMYLQTGKFYALPDGTDRSGISISRHAGKTVVCCVAVFSPAWWKGIKPQDVILTIEENRADQTSLYSLRRLLSMEDKNVKLTLQRGNKRIEASLTLPSGPVHVIRIKLPGAKKMTKGDREKAGTEDGGDRSLNR